MTPGESFTFLDTVPTRDRDTFALRPYRLYPSGLVNSFHWRPLSPHRTRVHRGWYSHDGVVDDRLQKVIDLDRDTTVSEDLALVEKVQRGLASLGYKPGPLVVNPNHGIDSEHSLTKLHEWMREAVDS